MHHDPFAKFQDWFELARNTASIIDATAMSLATADSTGKPSARIVLLKAFDERGFVFYTNLESRKSGELKENPHAALCFHWAPLERQIRIEGKVEPVSADEADAYFASRPRESQIGAWSSDQSRPLPDRDTLLERIEANTQKYEGKIVPRPPHWSGWRVIPQRIEFWQQVEFRLHEREIYIFQEDGWNFGFIYP